MRLYLSSYEFGRAPAHLAELALPRPVGSRAAIVMNATDVYGDERRAEYVERNRVGLARLGLDAQELDLRDYFGGGHGGSRSLGDDLDSCVLVWVVGGNSFVLHHRPDHPESADVGRVVEYFRANSMPYRALRDGSAIVVNGASEWLVG